MQGVQPRHYEVESDEVHLPDEARVSHVGDVQAAAEAGARGRGIAEHKEAGAGE